jgi:flagellar hook-basal body complex protein FliE
VTLHPLFSATNGANFRGSALLDFGGDDASAVADSGTSVAGVPSFSETLQKAFDNVNTMQNSAATAATSFATGQVNDIHSVMIAAQKATVALDLTTQVRNQVVGAYQQIMQMSM